MLESKRRALIFFIIALILAGLSGFLVLKKVQELNSDLGTLVTIYVANNTISSRELITPNHVTTDQIPKKYLRDDYITDVEELVNKVSVVPLSKDDIITRNMLKDYSSVTDSNHRLISILRSNRVFFDEELTDLDRVDIIVSHNFEGKPITKVFLEDVKVARVARNDSKEFAGIQVEVPYSIVPELVHMQNYADSFRIIKANVGQYIRHMTNEGEEETTDEDVTNTDTNVNGNDEKTDNVNPSSKENTDQSTKDEKNEDDSNKNDEPNDKGE